MYQKKGFLILALLLLLTTSISAADLTMAPLIMPTEQVTAPKSEETTANTAFYRWARQDNVPDRVSFQTRSGFVLLRKRDIMLIQVDAKTRDLLLYYRKKGQIKKVAISTSLCKVKDKLNEFPFLQVSRSAIVNINEVAEYEGTKRDACLVMEDDSKISVSRSKAGILYDWFNNLNS